MKRHGYHKGFALGAIAGLELPRHAHPTIGADDCLGHSDRTIHRSDFRRRRLSGLAVERACLSFTYSALHLMRPAAVGIGTGAGQRPKPRTPTVAEDEEEVSTVQFLISLTGIIIVIVAVLGGIWFGVFTPTEGAGAGAVIGLILGIIKGMRFRDIIDSILSVGRTSAPILLLLVTAALYSQHSRHDRHGQRHRRPFPGLRHEALVDYFGHGFGLVPARHDYRFDFHHVVDCRHLCAPIAVKLGYDPIAFAVIAIIAIEAGLYTPPFGLLVYTVKSAVQEIEPDLNVMIIFKSSTPYWILMLIGMILIVIFPEIATYLPRLLFPS